MTTIVIPHIKSFAVTTLALLITIASFGQKEKPVPVTTEMINKVAEIVKPLRDQADRLLKKDPTGNFKMFQEEVSKLNGVKSLAEKSSRSQKIREKYASFFKDIWSQMKVDEKSYQQQIWSVFPAVINERLTFQPFLNFSITVTTTTTEAAPQQTPPAPEDKCIDVCTIAAGEVSGSSGLISGGAGSYGNCFLKANSWGAAAGKNEVFSTLKNNISIPGTLPSDGRKLRVKKSFEVKQEAHSFATLGFGYAETRVTTPTFSGYLFVMSPVIFGAGKVEAKTVNEEYVLEKTEVSRSTVRAYANTFAFLISGNWCFSECNSIKWSICEEK